LTKADITAFYEQYMLPSSERRAKLCVYLVAQATSDVSTGQISELVKTLKVSPDLAAEAATDLQARLSSASHDEEKEVEGLKDYLLHNLKVAEDKIDAAVDAWLRISQSSSNGAAKVHAVNGSKDHQHPDLKGISKPALIQDVRTFKSGLRVTAGPLPVKDISEFEELDSKL
jgi:insulysin